MERGQVQDEARSARLLERLLAHRAEFLAHLERKVGNAAAEDLLQEALVRASSRFVELRNEEAVVGWFWRILENATVDHHRRRATSNRALEELAHEPHPLVVLPDSTPRPCRCVSRLSAELKPEYAQALQRIEVDGISVKEFAREKGISASNAGVRVFRARRALRRKVEATCGACAANGCTDCTCGE